jgi:multiple sugar transport system permease protein
MTAVDTRPLHRRLFEPRTITTQALVPKIATYAVLLFWTFVALMPLYWVFITSFKLPIQVDAGPFYLPFIDYQPTLDAWRYILVDIARDTLRPYVNSVVVALASTCLAVLVGAIAAYALVRIRFRIKIAAVACFIILLLAVLIAVGYRGVDWRLAAAVAIALFLLCLSTLARRFERALTNGDIEFWMISNRIMPPVVAVLPIYLMFQKLHLLDTWTALIATYTAVNLPIVVWLTRDFFAAIPRDLEESAEIDGASKFRVLFTIALPLARSGLAATFMLVFILAWNEYLLALFLSNVKAQTMPLLVAGMNGTRGPQWWYMSVVIIIMIAPVVLIAAVLQKHITRGILLGAVKGCFVLLAAASLLSSPAWSQNRPTDYRMWQRGYDRSTVYRNMTPALRMPDPVRVPRIVVPDNPGGRPELEGQARAYRGSLPMFSPEWLDYCRAKYNSFNPRTGKYLSYGGVYRTCR